MADHTDNQLRAAIKALRDVIAPAVDSADSLATEQLRLVTDYLEFLRERVDLLQDRRDFELRHHLDLARSLTHAAAGIDDPALLELEASIERAADVEREHRPRAADVADATAAVAAATTAVLRAADGWDDTVRRQVEALVIESSDAWIEAERAWFLPFGFDPSPTDVLPLEEALAR